MISRQQKVFNKYKCDGFHRQAGYSNIMICAMFPTFIVQSVCVPTSFFSVTEIKQVSFKMPVTANEGDVDIKSTIS